MKLTIKEDKLKEIVEDYIRKTYRTEAEAIFFFLEKYEIIAECIIKMKVKK